MQWGSNVCPFYRIAEDEMKYSMVLEVDPEVSMRLKIVYLAEDPRKFWKGNREVKQKEANTDSVLMKR